MLKTRFPFLYASTSLDTKTVLYKTLASNRHFESCMLIRCLPPQHILQFFQNFPRVFSLPLATLLIIVSSSLTFHLAIKVKKNKKRVCNGFLFLGNLGPKSVTLGGPVVLLASGSRGRDNLVAWGNLFANPYELKSGI